jgi:hypothetical protein
MTTPFEETAEFLLGRKREEEFLEHLAKRGHHAFPAYGAVGVDESSRSPKVWTPKGRVVAPDIMCITSDGLAVWCEVKAKTKPSFRWAGAHRGFFHGVDYRLFHRHYSILAEHAQNLYLVVCESHTLPCRGWEPGGKLPATQKSNGMPDWDEFESSLVPGPVWLVIDYEKAKRCGRLQKNWSSGKDGWLWPREAMAVLNVPQAIESAE